MLNKQGILLKQVVIECKLKNKFFCFENNELSIFFRILTDDLDDAASKAVRIADIVRQAEQIQIGVSFEIPQLT